MNSPMKVAVAAETVAGERRVALTPDGVKALVGDGWEVAVETAAGEGASFADSDYEAAGAEVTADARSCVSGATLLATVQPPDQRLVAVIDPGVVTVGFFDPGGPVEVLQALAKAKATVFSFDLLPRISRAQSMDALSSQATVSGYRAALETANRLGRFFPMLMTAAGTIPPARVLVMGVGVAGLQAIATARRLGAAVRAYDVRAAAKEEAESLGAKFVDTGIRAEGAGGYARELTPEQLAASQEALAEEVARSDAVITTAAVPGRRAPVLLTTAMVERMPPGSVVVDMAADSGGNCEATVGGREVTVGRATVFGMANPASTMPAHASVLYSRNVVGFVRLLRSGAKRAGAPAGKREPAGPSGGQGYQGGSMGDLDFDDEIVAGACVLAGGSPVNPRAAQNLGVEPPTIGARR